MKTIEQINYSEHELSFVGVFMISNSFQVFQGAFIKQTHPNDQRLLTTQVPFKRILLKKNPHPFMEYESVHQDGNRNSKHEHRFPFLLAGTIFIGRSLQLVQKKDADRR